jgi:glycosyltransferase involved in cell wall biosynthesis
MRKIKILYVVLELFAGGLENGIVNLVNNSSARIGHVICCLRRMGVFANRLPENVKVIELNMKYGNDYSLPHKLLKIIRREHIDIVRAFNEEPFFYSFLPAKVTRTPIIYYNGGRVFPEKKKRLIIERLFSNSADQVITPSDELKNYMINKVGVDKEKIKSIYNGVDLNRFIHHGDKNKKKELNIPENHLVIGSAGRLAEQKDFPTFLIIANKLLQFNDNITFLIIGDGPLKKELQNITQNYGINDRVSFLGFRNDIHEIYQIIDIFLLTSRWEGMSNVLLEAMACRKCVVATDVEGVKQIISDGDDGFIVKVGDVDGFVDCIISLDKNKRDELGNCAYQKVKELFSLEKMIKAYEALYLKILDI